MIDRYLSPAEFKRLLSALSVVLGFILLAMFFAFLVVPGLRYQAHTVDEGMVAAVQGENGWLDPTDYLPSRKQEIPPIDPKALMTASPDLLARGNVLFAQNCVSCHGDKGQGDGPGGKGLTPPPRNFADSAGWKNGTRIEDIYRTLEEGLKGSAMVSYNYLSKKDRMALVHYVQTMGPFDHGVSDPQARAHLENLFSSTGEVIPNRIPVRAAIHKLVEEYRPPTLKNECTTDTLPRAVVNRSRAAQTLAGMGAQERTDADFARAIVAGAPANGFAVRVGTYTKDQWHQLRRCLSFR